MRTVFLAAALAALSASGVQAACVSQPDSSDTRYVENGVRQTLCLNDELDERTQSLDEQTRYRVDLNFQMKKLQLDMQRRFDRF